MYTYPRLALKIPNWNSCFLACYMGLFLCEERQPWAGHLSSKSLDPMNLKSKDGTGYEILTTVLVEVSSPLPSLKPIAGKEIEWIEA